METIYIHSFSHKFSGRNVTLAVFDRLFYENKLYPITSKFGTTNWFFKVDSKAKIKANRIKQKVERIDLLKKLHPKNYEVLLALNNENTHK